MWFWLKGAPAVVTIGAREALWSEIAELAAMRGAQINFHLSYGKEEPLARRQIGANMASFSLLTAMVNAASPEQLDRPSAPANGGTIIWEDFRRNRLRTPMGFGYYAAQPLAEAAGESAQIVFAECKVNAANRRFKQMTDKTNPQMQDWYEMGARVVSGE